VGSPLLLRKTLEGPVEPSAETGLDLPLARSNELMKTIVAATMKIVAAKMKEDRDIVLIFRR
jgi:hypothetical protein